MFLAEEDVLLLTDIGFTKTQAKLYLTLLKLGQTDGNSLGKNAEVPRQIVYRTLDELQKMGLVEKYIGRPYKFKATPIKHGLQIIMLQRRQQYNEIREKAQIFLQKMQNYKKEKSQDHKYNFTILEGRERILQIFKLQHKKVKLKIDALSTLNRWLQIVHYCYKEFAGALDRKVKIRVVIEKPKYEISFPENIETLLAKPNLNLKFSHAPLVTNSGSFDHKEATFSFFPSKPLGDTPILLTNHPSFLSMARDHFQNVWNSATDY